LERYTATISLIVRVPVDAPRTDDELAALTREMVISGVEDFFGLVQEIDVTIVSSESLPDTD